MKSDELLIIAALALIVVGVAVSRKNSAMLVTSSPRGATFKTGSNMTLAEHNNNPLNIRFNPGNNWVGQTGSNGGFCVFSDKKYGYRAAFVLLNNYVKQGFDTISKVVNRWAPPADNNPTKSYINYVSDQTGIWAETPLRQGDFIGVIEAMAVFEGGVVDKTALMAGYKLAFG